MNDIELRVKQIIAEQLGAALADVTDEKLLSVDLGADSLDVIELVMNLEDAFGINISEDDAEKITTVKEAVDYVVSHKID